MNRASKKDIGFLPVKGKYNKSAPMIVVEKKALNKNIKVCGLCSFNCILLYIIN